MTKQEFLSELQTRLSGLPQSDLDERLGFYGEMIDDRMEDGLSEEDAVAAIGSIDEVVSQVLADYPLAKIVKEKVKPKRTLRAWEIVLLILGAPVWAPLLIAAFAVVLSLYLTVWSVLISLWAVELSLAASALCGFVAAVVFAVQGNLPAAAAALGTGLCCAGCTILLFFGCKAATKGILVLTKKAFVGMKAMLVGKERNK